jgi:ADP-dependent NAD(P)H-hydrate dehydratase / NAD(P)H-hydrate epimerase
MYPGRMVPVRGVWTVEQVRAAEAAAMAQLPDGALMRRAAHGLALRCAGLLAETTGGVVGRRVVLLVGAGDNGGDALWAGAFLRRRGVAVTALLLAPERAHAAGLAALRRRGGRALPAVAESAGLDGVMSGASGAGRSVDAQVWAELARAELVVDGIVGLSGRGPLRPVAAELVAAVTAPVVAVDLPSGVDPDTGAVDGPAVTAAETVTFGALKPVHVLAPHRCGRVRLVDIGIGGHLGRPALRVPDVAEIGAAWPVPGPLDDKYTQGVVGIAAGSATYPGAAVLTTGAAALATSGLVRYAGPAADLVRSRWPEVISTGSVSDAGRVQAWVVGPGLGTGSDGRHALRHALAAGVPLCLDADAITLLAADPTLWDAREPDVPIVITPHDREFARIAGEVGADRVAAARGAAAELGVTVLLKGHATVMADADGTVLVHPSTSSWAATGGSGDVLAGLIGALLAAGLPPLAAAAAATHVHGVAAALAASGAGRTSAGESGITDGGRPDARPMGRGGAGPMGRGGAGQRASAPVPVSALLAAVPNAIRAVRAAAHDAG